jgi:hypothetical protein
METESSRIPQKGKRRWIGALELRQVCTTTQMRKRWRGKWPYLPSNPQPVQQTVLEFTAENARVKKYARELANDGKMTSGNK